MVRNEQIKLSATFLNGLGIAAFAVGGFAPATALLRGEIAPSAGMVIVTLGCFVGALGLHLLARWILRGLRE
jgi:hypothetical protein